MADDEQEEDAKPKKGRMKPLLLGLVLALLGGGGGFYAVYSGMILGGESEVAEKEEPPAFEAPTRMGKAMDVAFVELEPLVISLNSARADHLRFRASLEVEATHEKDVQHLIPRVTDVLNSYLRALDITDLEDPAALVRLRAQMLRRVQVVLGGNHVSDLLILEFVLN
jgi:flagellar FliL protein